jgi:hypothetical protein
MARWVLLALATGCASSFSAGPDVDLGGAGDAGEGGAKEASGGSAGKGNPSGGTNAGGSGRGAEGGEDSGGGAGPTGGMAGMAGRGGKSGSGGRSDAGAGGSGARGGGESGGTSGAGAAGRVVGGAGGLVGIGGVAGSSAGTGGSIEPCPETFTVSNVGYMRMPSKAGTCWNGPASSGGDATSSWSPKSFELCGPDCVLSITGNVNAATAENGYAGLVNLSVSLNQILGSASKDTVVPTGSGLTLTYAATGATNVRIELSDATASYCYGLPAETGPDGSTLNVPYTAFEKKCWDPSLAVAYEHEPIEQIALTAPGGLEPHDYVLKLLYLEEY